MPSTSSKANFSGAESVSQTMKVGAKSWRSQIGSCSLRGEDLVAVVELLALQLDPLDAAEGVLELLQRLQPELAAGVEARGRARRTRGPRRCRPCSGSSWSRGCRCCRAVLLVGVEGEGAVDARRRAGPAGGARRSGRRPCAAAGCRPAAVPCPSAPSAALARRRRRRRTSVLASRGDRRRRRAGESEPARRADQRRTAGSIAKPIPAPTRTMTPISTLRLGLAEDALQVEAEQVAGVVDDLARGRRLAHRANLVDRSAATRLAGSGPLGAPSSLAGVAGKRLPRAEMRSRRLRLTVPSDGSPGMPGQCCVAKWGSVG